MGKAQMDLVKYRQEVDRLYHEYLKLWQESGGELPITLPGFWRPQYETFDLIVNLTDTEENVISKIDKFKKEILQERGETLKCLEMAYSNKSVGNGPPSRIDGKRISYKKTLEKAEKALAAYRLRLEKAQNFEIACNILGVSGNVTEKEAKSAERKVRQYLAHAETLIAAAGNGTFPEALKTPLLKK